MRTPDATAVRDARFLWRTFVLLLLFEGALRKWVVPSLATPLLLVRDVVGLGVLALAWRDRVRVGTPVLVWLMLFGGLSASASFFACFSAPVTVYGWRTNFFYIPVVYVLVRLLDESDVRWFARLLVRSVVPMTILVAMQAVSRGTGWVNKGAGEGSGQIMLAGGFVRASGTFSFVTGLMVYYPAVLWAILYQKFERREIGNGFAQVAVAFSLAGTVLTGSRFLLVFMVVGLVAGAISIVRLRPARAPYLLRATAILTSVLVFVAVLTPIGEAFGRFATRIATAEKSQSSSDRVTVWLMGPFEAAVEAPPLGYGMGLGTSVGSTLATGKAQLLFNQGGSETFTEIEGARHALEQGPILGLGYFLVRMAAILQLFFLCKRLTGKGMVSAWCLWANLAPQLFIGQMGQPTVLGFIVVLVVVAFLLEKSWLPPAQETPA